MLRFLTSPRSLLPLMIFLGVLVMGMRIGDIWDAAASGKLFSPVALAETKTDSPPADAAPAPAGTAPPSPTDAAAASTATPAGSSTLPAVSAPSLGDKNELTRAQNGDSTPAEMDVLRQLSDRREQLEKRARDLDTREDLLKVTEKRVDQKIQDLENLRKQLQAMVNQVSETQAAQTENLVKIYETMNPEEAARIFETLDMPVLLNVIQHMKPKSTAPIMAKMAPEKAKELTMALAHQDQLPQIK